MMIYRKTLNYDLFIFKKNIVILIIYNYMVEVAIVGCTILVGAFFIHKNSFNTVNETSANKPTVNGMIFKQR